MIAMIWRAAGETRPTKGGMMKLLLLFVPCVIALWVPLYNFETPALFGMPFFYWFQLLLIPLSALAIFAADRIGKALGMFDHLNVVAASVFVFFFALVTVLGFVAARWKAARPRAISSNGASAGERFGTWMTWFLLGGDLYTAYTVIADPGGRLRDRRLRILRRTLHDHHLSVPLSDAAEAVGGFAQARVHHRRRFRARPIRRSLA